MLYYLRKNKQCCWASLELIILQVRTMCQQLCLISLQILIHGKVRREQWGERSAPKWNNSGAFPLSTQSSPRRWEGWAGEGTWKRKNSARFCAQRDRREQNISLKSYQILKRNKHEVYDINKNWRMGHFLEQHGKFALSISDYQERSRSWFEWARNWLREGEKQ